MQGPKNSRVKHGTASCVRYGCTREECREARRRNDRAAWREGPSRAPSDEAYAYAVELTRANLSPNDIAERSGVSQSQVRKLLRGDLPTMMRVNLDAILGVPMPHEGNPGFRGGWTDATRARRRLQALAVQGFSTPFLSRESGMARLTINLIRTGAQQRIQLSTMREIVFLHDKFWDVDPLDIGLKLAAVSRTMKHAKREGWLPTEAWSDIDDPDCKPLLNTPKYIRIAEDYRELTQEQGYDRKGAAKRLGVTVDGLNAALGYYNKKMASAS